MFQCGLHLAAAPSSGGGVLRYRVRGHERHPHGDEQCCGGAPSRCGCGRGRGPRHPAHQLARREAAHAPPRRFPSR